MKRHAIRHLTALTLATITWDISRRISPIPAPFPLCAFAWWVTVYVIDWVWDWTGGPTEDDQQQLHRGATAYEQRTAGNPTLFDEIAGIDLDAFGRAHTIIDPDGIAWRVRNGRHLVPVQQKP